MAGPTLMSLPEEVREMILKLLLALDHPVFIMSSIPGTKGHILVQRSVFASTFIGRVRRAQPSILRVCSSFHASSLRNLYSDNIFEFRFVRMLKGWLWKINNGGKSQNSRLVKRLRFVIHTSRPEYQDFHDSDLQEMHDFWEGSAASALPGLRYVELDCAPRIEQMSNEKFVNWVRAKCEKASLAVEAGIPAGCVIENTFLRTLNTRPLSHGQP